MPSWEPPWDDVDFDFTAAAHAERLLVDTARFLDDRHLVIGPALAIARDDWRGPLRAAFDLAHERHERTAWLLVDELRVTAARISIAADEARVEQARREVARRLWWEEVAAERRIAEASVGAWSSGSTG